MQQHPINQQGASKRRLKAECGKKNDISLWSKSKDLLAIFIVLGHIAGVVVSMVFLGHRGMHLCESWAIIAAITSCMIGVHVEIWVVTPMIITGFKSKDLAILIIAAQASSSIVLIAVGFAVWRLTIGDHIGAEIAATLMTSGLVTFTFLLIRSNEIPHSQRELKKFIRDLLLHELLAVGMLTGVITIKIICQLPDEFVLGFVIAIAIITQLGYAVMVLFDCRLYEPVVFFAQKKS
tara:strand:+ start:232 stop:939 length:708 start_codon:yes stop_codon:yes gene_type:complete